MRDANQVDGPRPACVWALAVWAVVLAGAGAALVARGAVAGGWALVALGVVPAGLLVGAAAFVTHKAFGDMSSFLGDFATGEEDLQTLERAYRLGHQHFPPERLDALMENFLRMTPETNAWLAEHERDFERVDIEDADGARLVGHMARLHPDSHKWFIFCHGLGGGWKNGLRHARRFADKGYNLLLIEQRAQGASGGAVIGAGHLERRDAVLWCRRVAVDDPLARIVLMGESLGGATVLEAAGESELSPQVARIVSDSGYADFWNAAAALISPVVAGRKVSLAHPLLDLARIFFRAHRGGYDIADCRAVDAVARARVPILLIHGGHDNLIDPVNARRLDAACASEHELLVVEWGGHCSSAVADPDLYNSRLFSFVE
ncbi:alpha/beta hydrolase [Paratractidigestivibacter sp.]|uniref:alpha/beta hydrolase n=1 Tax=Paratractidigestivibacter sp. TaxID=2847316 RepID=UPI002AC90B42|nr:alpha/beta fold hydrolase [Paratractidigestivibacter sp.]